MGTSKITSASSSSSFLLLPYHVGIITYTYWYGLYYYTFGPGRYQSYQKKSSMILPSSLSVLHDSATTLSMSTSDKPSSQQQSSLLLLQQQINIHLYLLSCNFYLYHRNHYRKDTYVQDLQDNLSNVAIPGTAIPLSYFVYHNRIGLYCITVPFIVFLYPLVSFLAAIHLYYVTTTHATATKEQNTASSSSSPSTSSSSSSSSLSSSSIAHEYMIRLLAPNDWFTYWRYNSIIVALHAHVHHVTVESTITNSTTSSNSNSSNDNHYYQNCNNMSYEYAVENKWIFLQRGDQLHVPISPYMKTPKAIVVKHKNEEGGMGIYFYNNAAYNNNNNNNNDDSNTNGDWIIQERLYNSEWVSSLLPNHAPLSTFRVITCSRGATMNQNDNNNSNNSNNVTMNDIIPLSCVFRAGRDHAKTDHDAIFFNVDIHTGMIGGGTTNKHWYQLGLYNGIICTKWRTYETDRTNVHPDGNIPIYGNIVPNIQSMIQLVQNAHYTLCPHVPFCGWDVVLSSNPIVPICLLEVNLSCNFFRGTFDQQVCINCVCLCVCVCMFTYMNTCTCHSSIVD
jgi:hypothetical protein